MYQKEKVMGGFLLCKYGKGQLYEFPNLLQNIMCVLLILLTPPPPSAILLSLWHRGPCICLSENFKVILTPLHVLSSLI